MLSFSLIHHSSSSILQELLKAEKKRGDDLERRYAEALESAEVKRQKLDETERRVHQLQESLNRYHKPLFFPIFSPGTND